MTPDVVLLNGWGMTDAAWLPFVTALPGDCRVHTIDLDELHDGTGAGLEDVAAAAARRAPRHCDVVGWSLGAQVALQWAHDRPAQVRRAALIAATPCFVARPDWPAGMETAVFEGFAASVHRDPAAALTRFALLQARGDANMSAVARVLGAAVYPDTADARAALRAGLEWLRRTDLRPLAPEVRQPVYLAHGAEDAIVPVAAAARLDDELPAGRLYVMRGAGHAPHVSQPVALAACIQEFFYEH